MTDDDKKRLFRKLKLSLYDLDLILNSLNDTKSFYFRNGIEDRYEELDNLTRFIKASYLMDEGIREA